MSWYPALNAKEYGPTEKQGYPHAPSPPGGAKTGVAFHSMDGSWAGSRSGLHDVSVRKSWAMSVLKSGQVIQHFPATAHTWHSGSARQNIALVGVEFEGGGPRNPSEPLTDRQVRSGAHILAWLKAEFGWEALSRTATAKTLWEHGEIVNTACPSGRIPWTALVTKAEERDMAEVDELKQKLNQYMYLHHIGHAVTALFLRCAAQADLGAPYKDWPEELRAGFRQFVDGQVLPN